MSSKRPVGLNVCYSNSNVNGKFHVVIFGTSRECYFWMFAERSKKIQIKVGWGPTKMFHKKQTPYTALSWRITWRILHLDIFILLLALFCDEIGRYVITIFYNYIKMYVILYTHSVLHF